MPIEIAQSRLLTDALSIPMLGIEPGKWETLYVEAVSEETFVEWFVEDVRNCPFTSVVGCPMMAAYLTEILGYEVACNPVDIWVDCDSIVYVASLKDCLPRRGEPDLDMVRRAEKTFHRVMIAPYDVHISFSSRPTMSGS
jgi:hypothetical protein